MTMSRFRYDSILTAGIFLGPLLLGVGLAFAIVSARADPPGTALFTLFLLVAGVVMFATAKLSVLRSGHRLSFGWRSMSTFHRRLYLWGYALMVFGVLLGIGVLVVARS